MEDLKRCGSVVISVEFVYGNLRHIEINCRFCYESFKTLASFGVHLKNKHKWMIEALSEYYHNPAAKEEALELPNETLDTPETLEMETVFVEELPPCEKQNQDTDWDPKEEIDEAELLNEVVETTETPKVDTDAFKEEVITDDEQSQNTDVEWKSDKESENTEDWGNDVVAESVTSFKKNRCSFSSSTTREEVTLSIITQLEKYPDLWPIAFDHEKKKECEKYIDDIFNHIQKKFPIERFTKIFVRRTMANLKYKYGKAEIGEISTDQVPYYDYLGFLKGNTNRRVKEKLEIICNATGLFECPICHKGYKTKDYVTRHIRTLHRHEYTCKCDVCDKRFMFPNEMRRHRRVHTQEKPYVCELCGRSFRMRTQLNKHTNKSHLNLRNYKCKLCPKAYNDSGQLKTHLNMHEGRRPSICDTCGKSFYSNSHLLQHRKIHKDVKQYKCTICDKEFAQQSGRYSHMRTMHRTVPQSINADCTFPTIDDVLKKY